MPCSLDEACNCESSQLLLPASCWPASRDASIQHHMEPILPQMTQHPPLVTIICCCLQGCRGQHSNPRKA